MGCWTVWQRIVGVNYKVVTIQFLLVIAVQTGPEDFSVWVRSPHHVITGQTVQLYCNFSLPSPNHKFYSLQWFLDDQEIYRLVPGASRSLRRMLFNKHLIRIDLESSKLISPTTHQLVLQTVSMSQSGDYRCQVTLDSPPFRFLSASSPLVVMVLPERLPVMSGIKTRPYSATLGYLPGDKLSINCTSAPSYPPASLVWFLNKQKVDRWMVTSYLPTHTTNGLQSSILGLSFLVLAEHFRGPEKELWATCQSSMPPVQGVELPMERRLLLGTLKDDHQRTSGQMIQGGWSSSGAKIDTARLMWALAVIVNTGVL